MNNKKVEKNKETYSFSNKLSSHLERFINYILPNGKNETYIKKCKIYYSNLIIDKILESYYDYDDIKLLSSYKEELIILEQHINTDITEKINDYYIKLITN